MLLRQISVFLENKQGTLARVTKLLGESGIDLVAMSIADTTDFGIMRCIVNDPQQALKVLNEGGFTASTTEVLAVEVPDIPGGLAGVLDLLDNNHINVEYLYSFVRTPNDNALIMFRVEDNEKCMKIMEENNINVLDARQIAELTE